MRKQIPLDPEHPEGLSNCVTVKQTQLLHCLTWMHLSRDLQTKAMYFGYMEQLQLRLSYRLTYCLCQSYEVRKCITSEIQKL